MRVLSTLFLLSLPALAQTITTVAGNSSWGQVYNVAVDGAGNMYIADASRSYLYKVDPSGVTTVLAGTGRASFSGDGGPSTAAALSGPNGAAVGPDGSIYIADCGNDRIRRIAPNGIITTIAGTVGGFAGDGGPATAARMNCPVSIVFDAAGNLYFSDNFNLRVRKITPAGIISTVAGTGRLALSGDGGPATAADGWPVWLAIGPDGSLYYTDDGDARLSGNKRVRRVAPNGIVTTVAGTGVAGYTGDGGPARQAQLRSASGIAVDSGGNIFIADAVAVRIRRVDANGIITTYAGTGTAGTGGDGGPALQAQLNFPTGMTIDAAGNLLFADRNNLKIRRISPPPVPAIRPGNPVLTSFLGQAGFSSNTYVEIYGSGFSTTSRLWAGADFNGANAPTSLDGISVTVNNRPAFIYYVSPGQININTPEDSATGPVQVQVRTAQGLSNTVTVNRSRLSPTLQTVPQFLVNGRQYVVAQTADFRSFIGTPNLIPGVAFTAARPGQTILIYALGCGPTTPATQAGLVAGQNAALALPFEVRIGGRTAAVNFAGIVANAIGLYQFNIVVPDLPPGDHAVELTVDGVPNNQNLVLTVGQ